MTPLFTWLLFYFLPITVAGSIAKLWPARGNEPVGQDAFIVHAALLVSILGSQYTLFVSDAVFPWSAGDPYILFYAASALAAFLLLRTLGLWYAFSAFLQQLCMLSMAFVLYPAFPLGAVVLLIVPIYAAAHLLKVRYAFSRTVLFFAWGTAAVALFPLIPSIWLFAGIHTMAGAFLIRWGVLYPKSAIPKGCI